jgi:hypothetical protein
MSAVLAGEVQAYRPNVTDGDSIRRMTQTDLNELGPWLTRRLLEKRPDATPAMVMGWLRGCLNANEWFFVRGVECCGLAELVRRPLEIQPIAVEHFVFVPDDGDGLGERRSLYARMASWAMHQDASTLEVGKALSSEQNYLRQLFGANYVRSVTHYAVRLGKL